MIPNASNGLPLAPQPWRHVCYFQSCHGEHVDSGYFAPESMPVSMLLDILRGESFTIIDGTGDGKMPRSFMTGLLTWALVYERARIGRRAFLRNLPECNLVSYHHCVRVAASNHHHRTMNTIRKMAKMIGQHPPLAIEYQDGHYMRPSGAEQLLLAKWEEVFYDDKPKSIREALCV